MKIEDYPRAEIDSWIGGGRKVFCPKCSHWAVELEEEEGVFTCSNCKEKFYVPGKGAK